MVWKQSKKYCSLEFILLQGCCIDQCCIHMLFSGMQRSSITRICLAFPGNINAKCMSN